MNEEVFIMNTKNLKIAKFISGSPFTKYTYVEQVRLQV